MVALTQNAHGLVPVLECKSSVDGLCATRIAGMDGLNELTPVCDRLRAPRTGGKPEAGVAPDSMCERNDHFLQWLAAAHASDFNRGGGAGLFVTLGAAQGGLQIDEKRVEASRGLTIDVTCSPSGRQPHQDCPNLEQLLHLLQ